MGDYGQMERDPIGGSASKSWYGERAQAVGGPDRVGGGRWRLYAEALLLSQKLLLEQYRIRQGEVTISCAEDYEYFEQRLMHLVRLTNQALNRCQRRWENARATS